VVTALAGERVASAAELEALIPRLPLNREIPMEITRGGRPVQVIVRT
jgi:hypothetical protein